MPSKVDISVNEHEFLLQALRENSRLDGRAFNEFRNIDLTFGDEYGHASVRLGKTRVRCLISAEVTTPPSDRKFEGIFNISVEYSPMASPAIDAGRLSREEAVLSRVLEKAVRRSSALDTESLCLVAGLKCFAVRADIHILSHDGNITDASCIALLAALQHFRRPDVTVEGDAITIWGIQQREPVKLSIMHHPYCVSLGLFERGDIILADTTGAEEEAREGEIIISANRYGEVCQVVKQGGVGVMAQSIIPWTVLALEKVQAVSDLVQLRLSEDERKRSIGGLIGELRAENDR